MPVIGSDLTEEIRNQTQRTLLQYKTDINKLFGICMDVVKFARIMDAMVYEMQLLALNGVVHAAKVPGREGRPLLALGQVLTDLPEKIGPEVRELEGWCTKVAKNTAKCSDLVRRYYQQIMCLVTTVLKQIPDGETSFLREMADMNLSRSSDVAKFMKHSILEQMPPIIHGNLQRISHQCQVNHSETVQLLRESIQCLAKAKLASENIKGVGTTAQYLSLYIKVEAAYLSEKQDNFNNLAYTLNETIERLESNFLNMKDAIAQGSDALELLSCGRNV